MFRHSMSRLFALLIVGGLFPALALAGYTDSPPAQLGFTHSPLAGDDNGNGLRLSGGKIGRGSPTIAEIDGNTGNGKEIAIGGTDGKLYVYRKDGSLAWETQVAPACPSSYPDGMINTTPAVGALFGDGVPYIVIGYGTNVPSKDCNYGGIVAYDGRNGAQKWRWELKTASELIHGMMSSPALADVDGDGTLEVGFGTLERDIMVLKYQNGAIGKLWRFHNADTVISSPSFIDVDGDKLPDMVIGSDISANPKITPPTQDGGYVTAFRGTDGTIIWRNFYNQAIYSSPVIVDLDGNGSKEVVIGSGCFFDIATRGHWLKILNLTNGAEVRTLNADGCINSSPAVADLDGNGKLDIVAMVDGSVSGKGTMQAWQYDNPTPKWKTAPGTAIEGLSEPGLFNDVRSPVIADIDGNGSLEVLGVNYGEVVVYNGATGQQLTCNKCGNATKTLFAWFPLKATPAVGDLDGDGDLEVVIGGTHQNDQSHGYLYAWTNLQGTLGSPAGSAQLYSAPWPMFRGKPTHVGVLIPPALRSGTANVGLVTLPGGGARSFAVPLANDAEEALGWTAAKDQDWIGLSATSGSTPDTLTITLDPSGKAAGVYEGTVTISSGAGSPTISVRLVVADTVYSNYLPSVVR